MRYYTNKGSADPKGVIDLSTALECSDDDSFSNGFRIVLPKRVYFIQASREEERESWVKLVKWKLASSIASNLVNHKCPLYNSDICYLKIRSTITVTMYPLRLITTHH